jgi:hypothetical protein
MCPEMGHEKEAKKACCGNAHLVPRHENPESGRCAPSDLRRALTPWRSHVQRRHEMRRASIAAAVGVLLSASPSCAEQARSVGHREAGAIVFKKCMACH